MSKHYDAVLFDLLSALIDSWSLWDAVAGDLESGRRWRMRYLQMTSDADGFEPYLPLIAAAAETENLDRSLAAILAERWNQLEPWPEAQQVVQQLNRTTRVGVVTNCSESMGLEAASLLETEFELVLTAERAACYKPDPRIYAQAIATLGVPSARILYVAGSPFDVLGAADAGMPVYWHNRLGLHEPAVHGQAEIVSDSLLGLGQLLT